MHEILIINRKRATLKDLLVTVINRYDSQSGEGSFIFLFWYRNGFILRGLFFLRYKCFAKKERNEEKTIRLVITENRKNEEKKILSIKKVVPRVVAKCLPRDNKDGLQYARHIPSYVDLSLPEILSTLIVRKQSKASVYCDLWSPKKGENARALTWEAHMVPQLGACCTPAQHMHFNVKTSGICD